MLPVIMPVARHMFCCNLNVTSLFSHSRTETDNKNQDITGTSAVGKDPLAVNAICSIAWLAALCKVVNAKGSNIHNHDRKSMTRLATGRSSALTSCGEPSCIWYMSAVISTAPLYAALLRHKAVHDRPLQFSHISQHTRQAWQGKLDGS